MTVPTSTQSDHGNPAAILECPKCKTPRNHGALECAGCGIVFAKWQARQATNSQSPTQRRRSNAGPIPLVLVLAILIGGGIGIWWLSAGSALAANEILVTYDHGETCKWTDWAFRYRREVQNNYANGAMLTVGPPSYEVVDDTTLRVFTPSGAKLSVPQEEIREIFVTTMPDPHNSGSNQAISMTVTTTKTSHRLAAQELPEFSRSRVLVPVASHYFPGHSDDYMTWGNVRLTLAGTVPEDCITDREISLTRTGHPKKRTPVQITFAGT